MKPGPCRLDSVLLCGSVGGASASALHRSHDTEEQLSLSVASFRCCSLYSRVTVEQNIYIYTQSAVCSATNLTVTTGAAECEDVQSGGRMSPVCSRPGPAPAGCPHTVPGPKHDCRLNIRTSCVLFLVKRRSILRFNYMLLLEQLDPFLLQDTTLHTN